MKKHRIIFLFIPFMVLGSGGLSFAQKTSVIDSLLIVLQSAKEDTNKVNILNELCWKYTSKERKKALEYGKQGLALAEELDYTRGIAMNLSNIGYVHETQGNYKKAMEYYSQSLTVKEEMKDKEGIASSLNHIGVIHEYRGDYDKALAYYLRSLRITENLLEQAKQSENSDKIEENNQGIVNTLTNIGILYFYQGNYEKVVDYFLRSLKINKELGSNRGIADCMNNIGLVYSEEKKYDKALDYYKQSLKISEEHGDKQRIANTLNNIGIVYYNQGGNFEKVLDYLQRSLKIKRELGNKPGIVSGLNNLGELFAEHGYYDKAIVYSKKSLAMAKEMNAKEDIKNAYLNLAKTLAKMGDKHYKNAYEYHQLYSEIKDSLFNEESSKQIAEMQEKYESEKREKEIELLNKEKALQSTELNRQRIIIWSVAGGLLLVITLAFFIYRGYRQKQKANILLAAQKQVIETKNKDITDSIRYAQNIQNAILPTDKQIKELLPDSFVLFKPKDIVSGDFYWIAPLDSQGSPPAGGRRVLIAACDCTGHGVPGAFMSMIGNSLLNEVVNDKCITKPNEILYEVRKGIIDSLKQKGESGEQKDGMDAALCSIDLENMKLEYAGAYNPLYLIRNGELQQIKADKQPVSFLTREEKPFTNHDIDLQEGDTIYIFSDGYQDQFGGPRGKKFMSKRFRQLFIDIQTMNMDEQKEHLDKTIEEWKGDGEQVDDILVIGVRI